MFETDDRFRERILATLNPGAHYSAEEIGCAIGSQLDGLGALYGVYRQSLDMVGGWFDCSNLSTARMYDRTQTDEKFKDGSCFICNDNKTIGFLSRAWPVAVYGEMGELHGMTKSGRLVLMAQHPEAFATMKILARFFNLTEIECNEET